MTPIDFCRVNPSRCVSSAFIQKTERNHFVDISFLGFNMIFGADIFRFSSSNTVFEKKNYCKCEIEKFLCIFSNNKYSFVSKFSVDFSSPFGHKRMSQRTKENFCSLSNINILAKFAEIELKLQ